MTVRRNADLLTDLLIVGASFAGVACAIEEAARAGLGVTLIERKPDAGEKAAHHTGIVVKEAADELARLAYLPSELMRPIRGVRLYGSRLNSVALDSPGYFFLATDTPLLMRWLIAQGKTRASMCVLERCSRCARQGGGFTADGIGSSALHRRRDGRHPRLRGTSKLGVNQEFMFGVEAELTGVSLPEPERCTAFSTPSRAWLYRMGFDGVGVTQIGLAASSGAARLPISKRFSKTGASFFDLASMNIVARRAGLIPVGGPVTPIADDRVLLIADAAGLVSPSRQVDSHRFGVRPPRQRSPSPLRWLTTAAHYSARRSTCRSSNQAHAAHGVRCGPE